MKTYTVTIPDETAKVLEVRAMGIDNKPIEKWLSDFLIAAVETFIERKKRGLI